MPAAEETLYSLLLDEEGGMTIVITERDSAPDAPRLLHTGGDHLLLYRNAEDSVLLYYIHPQGRRLLAGLKEVGILEVPDEAYLKLAPDEDHVSRFYPAAVQKVKKMPLTGNSLPPDLKEAQRDEFVKLAEAVLPDES